MASFRAVVLRFPDSEKDGVSSWTAKDLGRVVEKRYKVSYSENGMLKLLKSLDLSRAKTRPVHPEADPRAQADFKKFRDLIAETAAAHPEAEGIEIRLQDETRIGQTGRNCRRWLQKGTRPTGIKDQRPNSGTIGPSTSSAPSARSATPPSAWSCRSSGPNVMQTFLDQLGGQVAPGAHALLIPPGPAGPVSSRDRMKGLLAFHGPRRLALRQRPGHAREHHAFLPPYSPELNAIERFWPYLEERFLSHRLWPDYDAIVDAVCEAWQRVTSDTGRIKTLCSMEWAEAVRN